MLIILWFSLLSLMTVYKSLGVSVDTRNGQTRAQMVTRFKTPHVKITLGRQNKDNKQIKVCQPVWGNKS